MVTKSAQKVLGVFVTAIFFQILSLLFPGWLDVLALLTLTAVVLLGVGAFSLLRTEDRGTISLTLLMIVAGLGFLAYGFWSSYTLMITPGGFGSYGYFLAQANILAGLMAAGMGFVLLNLSRKRFYE